MIDIGLAGAFIERAEPMAVDQTIEIQVPWPGSEIPFRAQLPRGVVAPRGRTAHLEVASARARGCSSSTCRRPTASGCGALLVEYCRQNPRVRRFLRHWPEAERAGRRPDGRLTRVARVRVVLVRPETSANVGACARVVATPAARGSTSCARATGARSSAGGPPGARTRCSSRRASSPTSAPALAGAALAVALTRPAPRGSPGRGRARRGRGDRGRSAARTAAALVFGPETNGLTNDEIGLCGRARHDPGAPGPAVLQPLPRGGDRGLRGLPRAAAARRRAAAARATHDQKERLLELLRGGPASPSDALPRANRPRLLRASGARSSSACDLTPKELRLLEHMARKMARRGRR